MKRLLFLSFSLLLLLGAAACSSSDKSDEQPADTQEESQDIQDDGASDDTADEEDADEAEEPEDAEEQEAAEDSSSNIPDSLKDYEESDEFAANIDDLNELNPEVETDNPNKRVILYSENDHEKKYKSIFIKDQKRLKIIELDGKDEGLIFNEVIK